MRFLNIMSVRLLLSSLAVLFCLSQSVSALQLDELVIEDDRVGELSGKLRVTKIARAERGLNVAIASRYEYEYRGLLHDDFLHDLQPRYVKSNARHGNILIDFPYEPLAEFDLLLHLRWSNGELLQNYRLHLAGLRQEARGKIIARLGATPLAPRQQPRDIDPKSISKAEEIKVRQGDDWENIAQAIRQVYLRPRDISKEQVMLALLQKNPNAFRSGKSLRSDANLRLPEYFEVLEFSSGEARRRVAGLQAPPPAVADDSSPSPQLELSSSNLQGEKLASLPAESLEDYARDHGLADELDKLAEEVEQIRDEERDKAVRETSDLSDSLNLLQRQIAEITRLIEIKSAQLYALEEELASGLHSDSSVQDIAPDWLGRRGGELYNLAAYYLGNWETYWDFARDEFVSRPRFWSGTLFIAAVVVGFSIWFVFYIIYLTINGLRYPQHSARWRRESGMMGGVRGGPDAASGNLDFANDDFIAPSSGKAAAKRPALKRGRKKRSADVNRIVTPPPAASPAPPPQPSPESDATAAVASEDFIQDNLGSATFDLIRAYINMGETERARSLLDQLAAQGTAEEKKIAKEILSDL